MGVASKQKVKEAQESEEVKHLRNHEIQEIYLEIQQRIGQLTEAAPREIRQQLINASVTLIRAKRNWIGTVGELENEVF